MGTIEQGHMHALSPEVRLTLSLIEERLPPSSTEGFPRLADAFVAEVDGALKDLDIVLAIAPGVTMLVNYCPLLEEHNLSGREGELADRVRDAALHAARFADELRVQLADAVGCAERLVDSACEDGLPVKLLSTHVAELCPFGGSGKARFVFTTEVLGNNLRPKRLQLNFGTSDELEELFWSDMETLTWRAIKREQLREAGAEGIVDLLTLNVIQRHSDPMRVLHAMRDREILVIADDVELVWRDGEISSMSGETARLGWKNHVVTVDDLIVPATRCVTAVGRLATELVDHWVLKGDIVIKNVTNLAEDGASSCVLNLEVPRFFFNLNSRTLWPVE